MKTYSEIWRVWDARDKTFLEKLMYCLGWTRRDITRELTCAWCGEKFEWSGESRNDTPNFCSNTHKVKSRDARAKRIREAQPAPSADKITKVVKSAQSGDKIARQFRSEPIAPAVPRVCTCRNHLGGRKQQYKDQQAAVTQLVRRHLRHGKHTIYKCPTADVWHIASEKLAIA